MTSLLSLLESKNRCLRRFLDLSTDFLASAEKGSFSDLSVLQESRDATIKAFELYDRKITEVATALPRESRTPDLICAVERSLSEKDALIGRILATDDRIISLIEAEKIKLMREVASTHKSMSTLQKFKSGWVAEANSGQGLDETL